MRKFPTDDPDSERLAEETLFFHPSAAESLDRVAREGYLIFLNVQASGLADTISRMRAAISSLRPLDLERDICSLLATVNWRFHNIACLALLSQKPTDATLEALWLAVARGSWVSPQLVATAALIDRDFDEKALGLIARNSTYFKSILSLAALLRRDGQMVVFDEASKLNFDEAQSLDQDNSMDLALERFHELQIAVGAV